MENLLKETKKILKENGKTLKDIKWIGTSIHYIDIEKFLELANTEYDSGYGGQEVAEDLLVVGDNWWLERHTYDGSEWWEFKSIPIKPKEKLVIKSLFADIGWETLEEINEREENESN